MWMEYEIVHVEVYYTQKDNDRIIKGAGTQEYS